MKNNFWSLIWSSFNEIQGSLITFIGIFVSILLTRFPVKTQIPLDSFIVTVLILLLIIATVIKAINTLFVEYKELQQKVSQPLIPKILSARKYEIMEREGILCLLERSELFSIGIFVSCYYKDEDGFELLIGTGTIINIQGDGKIQALIDRPTSGYQDILNKLANNDSQITSRVVIKPTIRGIE
ncbi:MAG: bZIP transcription factor [Cyanobacteria bacterium P01_G01_bin.39]